MNTNKLINRIKGIITNPINEWDIIVSENSNKQLIIKEYALPLIILISISTLIGSFGSPKFLAPSISYSVISAFIAMSVTIGAIYLSAYTLNEVLPHFGISKNLENSFKIIIYSSTPAYVASIIANLHWKLGFLNIFGLYAIYLFWLGSEKLLKINKEKRIGFVIISFLIILLTYIVLEIIIGGVILSTLFTYR